MPKPKKYSSPERRQTRGSEITPGLFSKHLAPSESMNAIRHDERHRRGFYHSVTTYPKPSFKGEPGFAVTHSKFIAREKKPHQDVVHTTHWVRTQEEALKHHRKALRGIIPRQQEK